MVASIQIARTNLYSENNAQTVLPCEGWGVTASQLDYYIYYYQLDYYGYYLQRYCGLQLMGSCTLVYFSSITASS